MDEYSSRSYYILVLKYLCDTLHRETTLTLRRTKIIIKMILVPTKTFFNVLIDYVTGFIGQFKFKYPNNINLFIFIDKYLDETYNLFGKSVMNLTGISD